LIGNLGGLEKNMVILRLHYNVVFGHTLTILARYYYHYRDRIMYT
jgi:hypothetical protein